MDLSLASPQGQYRTVLYNKWVKKLKAQNVPHTSEPTLIGTLGNPVKIRSWQVPARGEGIELLGWARNLLPLSPSFFICSEMLPLNPPRPSKRVVVRRGES